MHRLGHHLIGIEGLALLRSAADPDDAARARRVEELEAILARLDQPPYSASRDATPTERDAGYAAWAASYDSRHNVTIQLEEPAVHGLLADLEPASEVLDAACGTGRHAAFLVARGHEVVGVDSSPEMLELAAEKVPRARFVEGRLERLPFDDATFDAAVCALALSHAENQRPAIAELARVLRPGGRLVISNPHPLATGLLGWRAALEDGAGGLVVIPEYPHGHAECIDAYRDAGLRVERCIEPALGAGQAVAEAKVGLEEAYRTALTGFPVAIVWDLRRAPS